MNFRITYDLNRRGVYPFHVHAAGCPDAQEEEKFSSCRAWNYEAPTAKEAIESVIATFEYRCCNYYTGDFRIFPCCKNFSA